MESKALEQKPPFEVIMESEDQSYVHIFRDGKIWIGAIERTIALEIVRKLNALDKAESENQRLTEELKETKDWFQVFKEGIAKGTELYANLRFDDQEFTPYQIALQKVQRLTEELRIANEKIKTLVK